jgi:1,6-anhydro-N-acetylmuramate kinase
MVKTGLAAKVRSQSLGAGKHPRSSGRTKQAGYDERSDERSKEDFQATILQLDAATIERLMRQVRE